MTCTKRLVLTGYKVQYVDLREPKPRTTQEDIYTADREWLEAVTLLGQNVADTIKARYERGGYKVISVERIPGKRITIVNLGELWNGAEPPATDPESEDSPE